MLQERAGHGLEGKILDLGFGDGYFARELEGRGVRSFVGLDMSLDELRAHFGAPTSLGHDVVFQLEKALLRGRLENDRLATFDVLLTGR